MTTITMTFRTMQNMCDYKVHRDGTPIGLIGCAFRTGPCNKHHCPIWKRAERRQAKEMKKYNIIQPWHRKAKPLTFGPVPCCGWSQWKPKKARRGK